MRRLASAILVVTVLSLAVAVPPASSGVRQGRTIVVTSTADSGPGTLRQAMDLAQSGDSITFDAAIFPPTAPATISVTSMLPTMWRGNVTIDASDAGVILDGSSLPGD